MLKIFPSPKFNQNQFTLVKSNEAKWFETSGQIFKIQL